MCNFVFVASFIKDLVVLLPTTCPLTFFGLIYIEIAKFSSGLKLYNSLWGATIEELTVDVPIKLTTGEPTSSLNTIFL